MHKYPLFFLALFFIFYGTAQADFYQWEDDQGNVHITDYPPPAKSGKKIQVRNYEPAGSSSLPREEDQRMSKDGQKKDPDVILYTKNSCPDCDKAREYLQSKNIIFKEYNTDTNEEAAKKRKEIDDSNDAPFAIINRSQVYGFSESVYNKVLKTKP
jgi:glutaredoxin